MVPVTTPAREHSLDATANSGHLWPGIRGPGLTGRERIVATHC